METPQIDDLTEWGKIIVLHERHAFRCNFLTKSAKWWRGFFIFEVLTATRGRSSKSFILVLYKKTIRTKQTKVHFGYLVQRDQHGIIATHFTKRKVLFYCDVFVAAAQPSELEIPYCVRSLLGNLSKSLPLVLLRLPEWKCLGRVRLGGLLNFKFSKAKYKEAWSKEFKISFI